jgi:hypothetical protein
MDDGLTNVLSSERDSAWMSTSIKNHGTIADENHSRFRGEVISFLGTIGLQQLLSKLIFGLQQLLSKLFFRFVSFVSSSLFKEKIEVIDNVEARCSRLRGVFQAKCKLSAVRRQPYKHPGQWCARTVVSHAMVSVMAEQYRLRAIPESCPWPIVEEL